MNRESVESILELIRGLAPGDRVVLADEIDRLTTPTPRPSLRAIEPVSIGAVLRPFSRDDDLLEEMTGR